MIFAESADQIHHEVDIAGFEIATWRGPIHANELKHKARVARRKKIDHRRDNTRECRFSASDTNHSHSRVGNELDLFEPFLEVIKDGDATLEDGAAIVGQANTALASVQ